jgi:hypothetical protein
VLIPPDSPLRLLPENLDRKQLLFFDGIRVAVEMAERAYERLADTLHRSAITESSHEDRYRLVPFCLLDAWSIVDSTNRLRKLLMKLPRFKNDAPSLKIFLDRTKDIWGLRNLGQHLEGKIARLAAKGHTVWGTLTWLVLVDARIGKFKGGLLVSGSQFGTKHALPSINNIEMYANIDHVTLTAGGHEANLSAVMRATADFIPKLEGELTRLFSAPEFSGYAPAPSDFLLVADMEVLRGDGHGPDESST